MAPKQLTARRRVAAAVAAAGLLLATVTAIAQELAADAVVARRGDAVLTVADIDAKIRSMPPELRPGFLTDPGRMSALVDTMLLTAQIALEGRKQGTDKDPELVGDLAMATTEILSRRQIQRHLDEVERPDFELLAEEMYLASPERFAPLPRIDLRQIVIASQKHGEEAALAIATEAAKRAKAGEDFESLIKEYTDEAYTPGSTGRIEQADGSKMDPDFVKELAGLRTVGDVVGPVPTKHGYHVVLLERREAAKVPSFAEVKDRIVEQLASQFRDSERSRYLKRFSNQPFELNDALIKKLPDRYANAGADGAGSP